MNKKALAAITAILLAVSGILCGGCSKKNNDSSQLIEETSKSDVEEKTEAPTVTKKDKIYQEYLSQQKLCNVSKEFKLLEAGTARDNPNGLAAAVKYDFDKDGKDELVTFTFERNSTNGEDIRIDLLKVSGKNLDVVDSRYLTEMADISHQPKKDSIYFDVAATTEIVTSEYNGNLYFGCLFSEVYDDFNRGGDTFGGFGVFAIEDDKIAKQTIGYCERTVFDEVWAKLLPPSIRDTADTEGLVDDNNGIAVYTYSQTETKGLYTSYELALSNLLNEFGLDLEGKQNYSDYTEPDYHWVSKNQSDVKQILYTDYIYPYKSSFDYANPVISEFYAGIKLVLDSDLEELLENPHLFDGIYEDETKLYSDILNYPYYYPEVWDIFNNDDISTEYFIADINSDNKKELVICGRNSTYPYQTSIVAVKPDMSAVSSGAISDICAEELVVYDSGIITASNKLFSLTRDGRCIYLNTNTGETINSHYIETVDSYDLHMTSNVDSAMDLIEDELVEKEIELEKGNALRPKMNYCSIKYGLSYEKMIVIEDKSEMTYNSWQEAYTETIDDIIEGLSGDIKDYSFSLIYLDDDDIPELYLYKSGVMIEYIFTFNNNRVFSVFNGGYRTFVEKYIEKEGIFHESVAYPNSYYADEVYKLSNNRITELYVNGFNVDSRTGDQTPVYRINGKDASEEECNNEIKKYTNYKEIDMIYSYDEIIKVLGGEKVDKQPTTKPPIATQDESSEISGNTAKVKAEGGLNMRSGAGKDYDKVTLIPDGSTVEVIEESGDWTKVKYNSHTGWVKSSYLR